MQARILPFGRGFAWLSAGFSLWRKRPALMSYLTFGYLLMLLAVSLVPLIGQPLAALAMPMLSLGVLNGCRAIAHEETVGPEVLFSGFERHRQALVTVGGLYFIASLLVFLLTALLDGGRLQALLQGAGADADPFSLLSSLLLAVLLSTPVMMAYWFAPMLAGWFGISAPKALFFSLVACWRNWRPFLAYSLSLLVFVGVLPGLVIGLVSLLSPVLGSLLTLPLPLVLVPVVFASFYANAIDVFGQAPSAQVRVGQDV